MDGWMRVYVTFTQMFTRQEAFAGTSGQEEIPKKPFEHVGLKLRLKLRGNFTLDHSYFGSVHITIGHSVDC